MSQDDYRQWLEAALAIAAAKNVQALRQLLMVRHQRGLGSNRLAFDLCQIAMLQGRGDIVRDLLPGIGADDPFRGGFLVSRGYQELAAYQLDDGVPLVRQGFRAMQDCTRRFPFEALPPSELGVIGLVAYLFEKTDWQGPPDAGDVALPPPRPLAGSSSAGMPLTFATFADSAYFRSYVPRLVESLRQNGPAEAAIRLFVVNPDAEAEALAATLVEQCQVAVFAVEYQGDFLPEFCAAARFLHAGAVLRDCAAPVIFLDADSIIPAGGEAVLRQIASYPLCWVETGDMPPQLMIAASVVGAHPGPDSNRFFDVAAGYLRAKLRGFGPLWTFDQVALHRAIADLRANGGQGMELARVMPDGWTLPGSFVAAHKSGLDERRQMRTNAQFGYRGLDEDARPLWVRLRREAGHGRD